MMELSQVKMLTVGPERHLSYSLETKVYNELMPLALVIFVDKVVHGSFLTQYTEYIVFCVGTVQLCIMH